MQRRRYSPGTQECAVYTGYILQPNNLFVVNHGDPMAVYAYTISGIYLGLVASLEGFQPPIDVAYSADGVGLLHCQ